MNETKSDVQGVEGDANESMAEDWPYGPSDSEVLAAVTKMLRERIPAMGTDGLVQLKADCSEEGRERLGTNPQHRHGTTERWAWHAGYVSAMNDTLNMIKNRVGKFPVEDER